MTPETARRLRRAAAKAAHWIAERDQLIREGVAEGGSLRTVADAADVSHQTVKNIVDGGERVTPHLHAEHVEGCYRCDLSSDEAAPPERFYALSKIAAGDWLMPSNDAQTLWRFTRYTDGPSLGLMDWPTDRDVWLVRRTPLPPEGEIGRWELDLVPWEDVANCRTTRQACIDLALGYDE